MKLQRVGVALLALGVLGCASKTRVSTPETNTRQSVERSGLAASTYRADEHITKDQAIARAKAFAGPSELDGPVEEIDFAAAKDRFLGRAYNSPGVDPSESFYVVKLIRKGQGFGAQVPAPAGESPREFSEISLLVMKKGGKILGLAAK